MTTLMQRPDQSLRIEEEMRSSYLDYAMSVIVARALPDVRDGLKPVHRRILYAMHELSLAPNQAYKKSARIVGEVLGKYHPHGDSPVYEALVRMAQDFSLRAPLVDGQGNFGSVDDDPPAAMRYTEARLSAVAQEMLIDIERETVDFTENFDGSLNEPTVLPARLPNLLVNGSSGIAVGMATNIPPHNLREIGMAVVHLIDHPEATIHDLMEFVKGPDFPTSGIIRGHQGIIDAFTTGKGRVVVEARAEVIEGGRGRGAGRPQIIITEIPFQLNKATLVKKIASIAKERRVDGISDVRDESGREGIRVVVELSRDSDPEYVLRSLYAHTPMRSAFHVNMLALVDGAPRVVTLKNLLNYYIAFRREVTERRARFDLRKAQERAHVLEGLRKAIDNLDEVIALIRAADDTEAARNGLIATFDLSYIQAQAILDMQLRRLSSMERQRLEEEHDELLKTIAELEDLLASPGKVLTRIKDETVKLVDTYGTARKTEIDEQEAGAISEAQLVKQERVVVFLTERGYIKRMPMDTFKRQHRGGKGVVGLQTRDGDRIHRLHVMYTHDLVLLFTNRGKVYSLNCYNIPKEESRSTKGKALINLITAMQANERVQAVMTVKEVSRDGSLVIATSKGEAKRMPSSSFQTIRASGLICMDLEPGDEVVAVRPATESDEVFMVTQKGRAVRFPVATLRQRSRQAGGVRGIRLQPNDSVVSMDVALPTGKVLVVSERGYGKFTPMSSFPSRGRGAMGVMAQRITDKTGNVMAAVIVRECEELLAISSKNKIIRTPVNTIRSMGRQTQGVRVMVMDDNAVVVSVDCWEQVEEEEEDGTAAPSAAQNNTNQMELDVAAGLETTNGHVATDELDSEVDEEEEDEAEDEEDIDDTDGGEEEEEVNGDNDE